MLSPASLRICCLAVMAPALTKAVSQAESFNLPHIPYLLDINILPCPLQNTEDSKNTYCNLLNDKGIVRSKQIKASSNVNINDSLVPNYGLWLKKSSKYSSWLEDIIKHLIVNVSSEHHKLLQGHKYKENGDCKGESCSGVGVCVGRPTTKTCNSEGTMNKDIPVSQDRMGLLNANTSLDCDFKTKISIDRQSASPTDLSIMSPKELGQISDIPFSDIQDTMDHPLTPPASRPGSEPAVGSSSATSNNVCISEIQEAKSNHVTLVRRAEYHISRLRKLQEKQCELHISGQLKAFLSHQQKSLGIHCQRQQRHNSYRRTKDSVDLKAELLQSEDVRNLSTAALVNLVRKLESSHASGKFLQSHKSSVVSSYGECHINEKDKVIVKINIHECSEINRASGTLLTNLRHLESAVDSDVTESSSGGESCDEFDGYEEKKIQHPPPIQKRAMWKWSVDRAAVASRWTWLQAQVSDLEYRIRQQNEIYRQLRATKGSVSLEQIPSLDNSTLTTSLDGISCQGIGSNQVVAKHPKTVNGFLDRGSVTSNGYHTVRSVPPSPDQCLDFQLKQQQQFVPAELNSCQTSRTRPLKSSFRKRKLLRTTGLHLVSRRAARLSTVRCSCNCQCDMLPCALCGGRYNNTQSVDPDMMPLLERIALLDPAFHPVLSFEQDISLPLHFETLLKKSELYHYSSRAGPSLQKKPRLAVNSKGLSDQARKHSRKLARNAAQTLLSSAKYRKKHGGRKPDTKRFSKRGGILNKFRRKYGDNDISLEALKKAQERRRRLSAASSCSSKPDSPVPSPSSICSDGGGNGILFNSFSAQGCGRSGSLQELMKKRRGDNAFDINNIVIPYSIASATRVEKLQYKEILTPKWRVIEDPALSGDENGTPKSEDEEMEEDASDEAVSRRHQKCEEDEKKRFVSHLHLPSHSRIRFRGSRYDYRADSSGANTPDPLSPYHPDIMIQDSNSIITGGPSSPALSPPATPIPISAFSDDSQPSGSMIPAARSERKRTTSLSKRDRPAEDIIKIPEKEQVYSPPYDSRIFPLLDDEFEEMLKNSPHLEFFGLTSVEEMSPKDPSSPASLLSTTSASSVLDDEMADPEWTVVSREKGPEQTLVLKLAKRYQAPQLKHRTININ